MEMHCGKNKRSRQMLSAFWSFLPASSCCGGRKEAADLQFLLPSERVKSNSPTTVGRTVVAWKVLNWGLGVNSRKKSLFSLHECSFENTCIIDHSSICDEFPFLKWSPYLQVLFLCYTSIIFLFWPLLMHQISQIVGLGPYLGCQGSLFGPYFIKIWVNACRSLLVLPMVQSQWWAGFAG